MKYSKLEILPGLLGFQVIAYKIVGGLHAATGKFFFSSEDDLLEWLEGVAPKVDSVL